MRSFLLVAAGVCVCWTSREARADERQPSADLRGLHAPMHHDAGLAVEPADSPDTGAVTANMRLVYAFRPVVLRDDSGEIAYHVVEHQFTTDVGLSVGLFGRLSVAAALAVGLVLFAAQVGLSLWWLARYRYGPVEWLWHSLMYGKRQPMAVS